MPFSTPIKQGRTAGELINWFGQKAPEIWRHDRCGHLLSSQFQGGKRKKMAPGTTPLSQQAAMSGMPLDEYQQEALYMSNNRGICGFLNSMDR